LLPLISRFVLGGDNAPQMRVFEIVRERKGRRPPRRIPFALATLIGAAEDARAAMLGQPPLLSWRSCLPFAIASISSPGRGV
jgi:hypothetical protein